MDKERMDRIRERLTYPFYTRHGTLIEKRPIVKITRDEDMPYNFWLHFDNAPQISVTKAYLNDMHPGDWKKLLVTE